MANTLKKERVGQYDVLRVITTLLVVVSHGHYHALITAYGGCDYSALVGAGNSSWSLIHGLIHFINAFTMPVFMALGGALFYRSLQSGSIRSFRQLVVSKSKRLLIPFFVVSTLYSFPLKWATGYFDGTQSVLEDFVVGQLLVQGNTHLWYLPAMFFDFLICYGLERHVKLPRWLIVTVLAMVSVLAWDIPVQLVSYPLRHALWFYCGCCFERWRQGSDRTFTIPHGLAGCVALALVYMGVGRIAPYGIRLVIRFVCQKLLVPTVAGWALYALSCGIARTGLVKTGVYRCLSRNSFGIYLYSDPVNYLILYVAAATIGPFFFGDALGTMVLFGMRIVITLGCGIAVSELLRKCKVKYIV